MKSAEHILLYLGEKHIVLGEDLHLDFLAPESTRTVLTSFELLWRNRQQTQRERKKLYKFERLTWLNCYSGQQYFYVSFIW